MKFMVDRKPLWVGYGFEVRMLANGSPDEAVAFGGQLCRAPCYVKSLVLEQVTPENEYNVIPPAFELSNAQAQQLCDALWEAGVRPTNGAGSVGQLAAVQEHLRDMKTIAFSALKIRGEDKP